MKKVSVLIAVFVFVLGGAVHAQEEWVGRDILEISLYGGLGLPSGGITDWTTGQELDAPRARGAETGWNIGIDIGYYVTYRLNVGIQFKYTQFGLQSDPLLTVPDEHSHRLYNPNVYAKYSFEGESYWVPYIKAHVGLENPKFSTFVFDQNVNATKYRELSYDPALAFGGAVGLFYYTADFSGLFVEAGYHIAMTEDVEADYQDQKYRFGENLGVFSINAGVKFIIGSGE